MTAEKATTGPETLAIAASVAAGLAPLTVEDSVPLIRLPPGYSVESLEQYLEAPQRKKCTVYLRTAESFIDFFDRHNETGSTSNYLDDDPKRPSFLAVFDDHADDAPGWRDFRAEYACPLSKEWVIWTIHNAKQMNQTQFAQFIEDNLPDVVNPDGGTMLEISRTMEATKAVAFKSAIRLSDGTQEFSYSEDVQGTPRGGQLKIPETFDLGIPVFNGGQAYKVVARLRYRIAEGKLSLWYELVRPHKVIEDAIDQVRKHIEQETQLKAFVGHI